MSILLSALSVIGILLLIVVGLDLFIFGRDFFFRLKIGKWTNRNDWYTHIQHINSQWLRKTPTVKLTDNSRYVIIDILKGKFRNATIQSWQDAGTLIGALHTTNNENAISLGISKHIDLKTNAWKTLPKHVDGVLLAHAIWKSQKTTNFDQAYIQETLQLIEDHIQEDGTVCYRSFLPDIRFVDTIGFICPFLIKYGIASNETKYVDLAIHQIKSYQNKAVLPKANMPAHAYNLNLDIPLGIYGWGRGTGWYILGLVDAFLELPKEHKDRDYLIEIIEKTAKGLLVFQKGNGSFHSVLHLDTRHDSSITCLAGWLFIHVYEWTKNETYLQATKKCIESLMQVTRRNGVIDFCQGDTKGIGVYAETFEPMPFVQGLTVRLTNKYNNIVS